MTLLTMLTLYEQTQYLVTNLMLMVLCHVARKNGITKKVFGNSIIRGIRVRDFNQQVKNDYTKFKSFPGCNSKEILHYIEPTLETGFYDNVILHVAVNDLLNDKL